MIELIGVTKRYRQTPVLRSISMTIDAPGIYCLLGRNGAGKTTLLKSIAGYQNISEGKILVDGRAVSTAAMDTGVSYIENFAKHFNLPVRRLLRIAGELNPEFDFDFAFEIMDRFELDGKKKFSHLSLGMKTMVSTIVCLSSNKRVILLDEPVLGFDAIMRVEFYDMLAESFRRHPRVILVSTHIIEEIAKTIQKLIIIDRGSIRFFDTLQAVEEKAWSVSGLKRDVDAATQGLHVIGEENVGGLVRAASSTRRRRRKAPSRSPRSPCRISSFRWWGIKEGSENERSFYRYAAGAFEQPDQLYRYGGCRPLRDDLGRFGNCAEQWKLHVASRRSVAVFLRVLRLREADAPRRRQAGLLRGEPDGLRRAGAARLRGQFRVLLCGRPAQ